MRIRRACAEAGFYPDVLRITAFSFDKLIVNFWFAIDAELVKRVVGLVCLDKGEKHNTTANCYHAHD